jgi:hypothetical protein
MATHGGCWNTYQRRQGSAWEVHRIQGMTIMEGEGRLQSEIGDDYNDCIQK